MEPLLIWNVFGLVQDSTQLVFRQDGFFVCPHKAHIKHIALKSQQKLFYAPATVPEGHTPFKKTLQDWQSASELHSLSVVSNSSTPRPRIAGSVQVENAHSTSASPQVILAQLRKLMLQLSKRAIYFRGHVQDLVNHLQQIDSAQQGPINEMKAQSKALTDLRTSATATIATLQQSLPSDLQQSKGVLSHLSADLESEAAAFEQLTRALVDVETKCQDLHTMIDELINDAINIAKSDSIRSNEKRAWRLINSLVCSRC